MATVRFVVKSNRFPSCPAKMRAAAGKRIHAAGFRVEGDAKGRAPVDTGALRASLINTPTGPLSTTISAGVDYALFVERGTRRMAPQSFMQPAMEAEQPRLEASFANIEGEL